MFISLCDRFRGKVKTVQSVNARESALDMVAAVPMESVFVGDSLMEVIVHRKNVSLVAIKIKFVTVNLALVSVN